MTAQAQRVGLYGGAFDPPHRTHSALAHAFVRQAGLQRLHICPTAGAWHKSRGLTDAAHRLRLCELAFAEVQGAQIDPREIERGGASYTVDTLEQLHALYPTAQLFMLIGQDQFESLPTWKSLARIEALATICVAQRPATAGAANEATPKEQTNERTIGVSALKPGYLLLDWQACDDSATVVRERRHAGQAIDDLVTPAVARYIADNHLYL